MCYGATGSCPGSGSNFGPAAVDRCRDLVAMRNSPGKPNCCSGGSSLIPAVNPWKAGSRKLSMG